MKIGVIVELLRQKTLKEDLEYAKKIGVQGVQLLPWAHGEGEINLLDCTDEELAALKAQVDELGLEITAICGDCGGSFQVEHEAKGRVSTFKKIVSQMKKEAEEKLR